MLKVASFCEYDQRGKDGTLDDAGASHGSPLVLTRRRQIVTEGQQLYHRRQVYNEVGWLCCSQLRNRHWIKLEHDFCSVSWSSYLAQFSIEGLRGLVPTTHQQIGGQGVLACEWSGVRHISARFLWVPWGAHWSSRQSCTDLRDTFIASVGVRRHSLAQFVCWAHGTNQLSWWQLPRYLGWQLICVEDLSGGLWCSPCQCRSHYRSLRWLPSRGWREELLWLVRQLPVSFIISVRGGRRLCSTHYLVFVRGETWARVGCQSLWGAYESKTLGRRDFSKQLLMRDAAAYQWQWHQLATWASQWLWVFSQLKWG